ncbi:SOS response-associated peptidase family protein [Rhizobium sp. CB3090]|uniref:SOS response-associated peptidase family protein n=1 Tax=Rhizobium sp. CB3090 TaxID=3039156 RepID=UPI0024B2482A|nr:SOS response-associated peptidase family protein [Rhizobium sp. CB3090]WFU10320.1 SOS response-associated peptidase family protein [Rhizobium sp. CB3090]
MPNWTGVRKIKEGEVTCDVYAFLTTAPNRIVGEIHEAMPVVLRNEEEIELWMTASWEEAKRLLHRRSVRIDPISRASRVWWQLLPDSANIPWTR